LQHSLKRNKISLPL